MAFLVQVEAWHMPGGIVSRLRRRSRVHTGRTIIVLLVWYPRLSSASVEQGCHWKLACAGYGIHWLDLDEDLSTEGLLRCALRPLSHPTRARRQRRAIKACQERLREHSDPLHRVGRKARQGISPPNRVVRICLHWPLASVLTICRILFR